MSIENLEEEIKSKEILVEKANKLTKLFNNEEFKELILDGYLEKESARLAKSLPAYSKDQREDVYSSLYGIGSLWGYLRNIEQAGLNAEVDIHNTKEEIYLLRQEGSN